MAPRIERDSGGSGGRTADARAGRPRAGGARSSIIAAMVLALVGCSGEPSERELKNRRELEALLTAVSLRNKTELGRDAERIEARHTSGELSDAPYQTLQEILKKAKAGDWAGAEKQAYEFRESTPFFE
jgi:Flp pilus assembly protein TadD